MACPRIFYVGEEVAEYQSTVAAVFEQFMTESCVWKIVWSGKSMTSA